MHVHVDGQDSLGEGGGIINLPGGLVLNRCIRGKLTRQVVLAAGARAKGAPEPAPNPAGQTGRANLF